VLNIFPRLLKVLGSVFKLVLLSMCMGGVFAITYRAGKDFGLSAWD